MSHEFDHPYSDFGRATPLSFQPKHASTSYSTGEPSTSAPSGSMGDSVFRFLPHNTSAPVETSSCPPDGPSHPIDFENDLSSMAVLASDPSASDTKAEASDATLMFPELPASLLDEAPEYEFSTHTRVNVFAEPQEYGDGFATAFDLGAEGTPLMGGSTHEYGLWSGPVDQTNEQTFQPDYLYQQASHDALDRPELLPRTAEYHDPQLSGGSSGTLAGDASPDGPSESGEHRRPPPPYVAGQSTPSERGPNSSALLSDAPPPPLGLGDFPPSVLYPAQNSEVSQRAGPSNEGMHDSQAYPSRGALRRARDSPNGPSSSFESVRAGPYPRAGGEPFPQSRRHSEEKALGSRGPVVPSQAPGRGRLMSWQAGRMGVAAEGEWQGTVPVQAMNGGPLYRNGGELVSDEGFATAGMIGNPGMLGSESHPSAGVVSAGIGAGPGPNQYAIGGRGPVAFAMHPPQRHHPYGVPMQHHSGHYMGAHGMHANQAEMINAMGDAMDASIDAEGIARCPYPNCNKTFAKNRSYNLKAHLRSHSQMKPFACAVCPRAFSRKHDLERHARVHSGDKPYVCEICGKGFPRSDALRRHWRVEKECGEKAAQLEAGQPLAAVMSNGHLSVGQLHDHGPGPHHHYSDHHAWVEAQRRHLG